MPDYNYWYTDDYDNRFENDQITVKYDAGDGEKTFVLYKNEEYDYFYYGAPTIDDYTFDFSEYPIRVEVGSESVCFASPNEVRQFTIEILGQTAGTPAIWSKVGSGDSPSPTPTTEDDLIVLTTTQIPNRGETPTFNPVSMTSLEIKEALSNNKNVVIIVDADEYEYTDVSYYADYSEEDNTAQFLSFRANGDSCYYVNSNGDFGILQEQLIAV